MDETVDSPAEVTRAAWAEASQKYEREHEEHLRAARRAELLPTEVEAIGALLPGADVVHPLSGHGLDDLAMVALGARSVHGLDYSGPAVRSAQRRADLLETPCRYTLARWPDSGLPAASADLVYTGKGALIWLDDLEASIAEAHRVLRGGGHLFVYEAHPMTPLWAWDADQVRVRPDRDYFATSHVNDSFPAHGAVEQQHTLSELVVAVVGAGFEIERFAEHPEPFWRPDGSMTVAAWQGRVPNAFSLLARRR